MIITKKTEDKSLTWNKILKDKTNQLDFDKILKNPEDVPQDVLDELPEILKYAEHGLESEKFIIKVYKIFFFILAISLSLVVVFFSIGFSLKITSLWSLGLVLLLIAFIAFFTTGIIQLNEYPSNDYLYIKFFLLKIRVIFKDEVELYPLTITILYYPEELKKLRWRTQLKIIASTKKSYNTILTENNRNLLGQWANARTILEFSNFIIQFYNFVKSK